MRKNGLINKVSSKNIVSSKRDMQVLNERSKAYFYGQGNVVAFTGDDFHIRSLYWGTDEGNDDLSWIAQTPNAASSPVAYYTPHNDMNQIFYKSRTNGHLYELFWAGNHAVQGWDITEASGSPAMGTIPTSMPCSAFYSKKRNEKHVIYRTIEGQLHDISWTPGVSNIVYTPISERYTLPKSVGQPRAFALEKTNELYLVYYGAGSASGVSVIEVVW